MKAMSVAVTPPPRVRRNAAAVVEEPSIVVVESAEVADPSALKDALGLLVSWAIRACSSPRPEARPAEATLGTPPTPAEAATPRQVATYAAED